MPLRLHNTLTKRVEEFRPLRAGKVSFYSCGPTVYDYAHVGNFRSFLAADVLRRWVESPLCARVDPEGNPDGSGGGSGGGGYDVTQVMNITDVGHMVDDDDADGGGDDKMEAAHKRLLEAKKSGKLPAGVNLDPNDPYAIAEFYAGAFIEDARTLGMRVVAEAEKRPELMPRPTRVITQMLEMIVRLIESGHAYIASDGVAYFDTQTFPDYGRLSGNTLEKIRSGAGGRVSEQTQGIKKHPADFMLWKPDPAHLMRWDPAKLLGRDVGLGEGYPGWHIECSVMAASVLGEEIDLHSGGEDNIFPHHECEIAQSRCAFSTPFFARYWFHPRFLMVEGGKMSKSKGTFFTVRDLRAKGFSPAAIRLELIKTHYRSNANFTEQGLYDSERRINRWRQYARMLTRDQDAPIPSPNAPGFTGDLEGAGERLDDFADAMNGDLNVSVALSVLDELVAESGGDERQAFDEEINAKLGGDPKDVELPNLPDAPLSPSEAWALFERGKHDGTLARDLAALHLIDNVLGVIFMPPHTQASDPDAPMIDDLVAQRNAARKGKNFAEADRLRDELAAMGVEITDGPQGTTWSRKAKL